VLGGLPLVGLVPRFAAAMSLASVASRAEPLPSAQRMKREID
jgi:hypothetical protein